MTVKQCCLCNSKIAAELVKILLHSSKWKQTVSKELMRSGMKEKALFEVSEDENLFRITKY